MIAEMETNRLRLRQWTESDLDAFSKLNDDPIVMEFMATRLDKAESDKRAHKIRDRIEERGWGLWAVDVRGVAPFIGFVGLSSPRFEAHSTSVSR